MESTELIVAFSDGSIWLRIGLVSLVTFIAITMIKQTIRTLPVTGKGAGLLDQPWSKPVLYLLPYAIAIGIAYIPGVFTTAGGITALLGVIAAHFSERIYKAFAGAIPNLVLSSASVHRNGNVATTQPTVPPDEQLGLPFSGGDDADSMQP